MFAKLRFEDQTALSLINDTSVSIKCHGHEQEFQKCMCHCMYFKVCTNTCIYPVPRYKDILIIECSSSDLQDISPNMLVKDSHLKDYDKISVQSIMYTDINCCSSLSQFNTYCSVSVGLSYTVFRFCNLFDCMLTWLRKLRNLLLLCVYDQWLH